MPGLQVETMHNTSFLYLRNQVSLARQYVFGSPLHFSTYSYSILPAISLDGIHHLQVLDHAHSGQEKDQLQTGK